MGFKMNPPMDEPYFSQEELAAFNLVMKTLFQDNADSRLIDGFIRYVENSGYDWGWAKEEQAKARLEFARWVAWAGRG